MPEKQDRESIWSVSKETKGLYFMVFIALVLVGAGLVTYEEVHVVKADGILDTALAAWWGVGRLILPSVAGSLIVTEAWRNGMVLAERLEEWFEKREAEADSQGGGRGGRKDAGGNHRPFGWQWNDRRVEAERRGEVFDEPPPSSN